MAGAAVKHEHGGLLFIKRGHEPGAGSWSLPGGRVKPGETEAKALVRGPGPGSRGGTSAQQPLAADRKRKPSWTSGYAATVIGGTLNPGRSGRADDRDFGNVLTAEDLTEILTS
jgi:8-oxo-dGTP diphosphatase